MEKIKDVEIQQLIFHDMHDVMFMSIEPKKKIEAFKERGRIKILQSFDMFLVTHGLVIFGPPTTNLVRVHKCNMRLFIACS